MEWIISFLLVFLVVSAIAQLFWAYALSAIAQKGGQSDLMQVLAWIPILQMGPMIVAGGGSIGGFVLGLLGVTAGCIALGFSSVFIGGTVGAAITWLGFLFIVIFSLGYLGRLFSATAVNRGLPGSAGLLCFVPIANFFAYPYMAFHDGWTAPNKFGLAIGLVLAIGSTAPSFQIIEMMEMNQQGGSLPDIVALLSGPEIQTELGTESFDAAIAHSNAEPEGMAETTAAFDPQASIRALYQLKERFDSLESQLDAANLQAPEQRQRAVDMLRSIDIELKAHRSALDPQVYQQLATHLVEIEARVHAVPSRLILARTDPSQGGALPFQDPRPSTPGPASFSASSEHSAAPIRPIPVQPSDGCPTGAELRTRARGDAEEEWCQQLDEHGGLRHGWYARYHPGGQPESMGEYTDGLRVGVWTRFYASGQVRAQAQFVEGMQHGWLLSFDEEGSRTKAVRFDRGVALR